jgi:GTPase SAR1 family protein
MSLAARMGTSFKQENLKLVIAGPKNVGKTMIANFIAGQSQELSSDEDNEYIPTAGVRILEFDAPVANSQASIELWDSSGSHEYEVRFTSESSPARCDMERILPDNS